MLSRVWALISDNFEVKHWEVLLSIKKGKPQISLGLTELWFFSFMSKSNTVHFIGGGLVARDYIWKVSVLGTSVYWMPSGYCCCCHLYYCYTSKRVFGERIVVWGKTHGGSYDRVSFRYLALVTNYVCAFSPGESCTSSLASCL